MVYLNHEQPIEKGVNRWSHRYTYISEMQICFEYKHTSLAVFNFTNRFMTDWNTQELPDPIDLIIVCLGYISRRNVQTPGQPIMIFVDTILQG